MISSAATDSCIYDELISRPNTWNQKDVFENRVYLNVEWNIYFFQ
jgi:hypothetical protein